MPRRPGNTSQTEAQHEYIAALCEETHLRNRQIARKRQCGEGTVHDVRRRVAEVDTENVDPTNFENSKGAGRPPVITLRDRRGVIRHALSSEKHSLQVGPKNASRSYISKKTKRGY